MIRLIYRHYCDRCHAVIKVEESELIGEVFQRPSRERYAGLDLCPRCTEHVAKHLRKAMAE